MWCWRFKAVSLALVASEPHGHYLDVTDPVVRYRAIALIGAGASVVGVGDGASESVAGVEVRECRVESLTPRLGGLVGQYALGDVASVVAALCAAGHDLHARRGADVVRPCIELPGQLCASTEQQLPPPG